MAGGSFALPASDLKGSVWSGQARVRGPRWAQYPLLTIGLLGVQIVWSVEMAYASPFLLSLGLKKSHMALVFVAGPLSGLIMQPLIGVLADHSTSSFGRRRPYMLAGSSLTIGGLLLLGFPREFSGFFGGSTGLTIAIAVYAIFCIDFSINAAMAVDRALLVDILPPHDQALGSAWAGRILGLGAVAGFFFGGVDLPRVAPWLGRTQLEVLTVVASILLIGLHGITAVSVEEKVLVSDGSATEGNMLGRIFKDIWHNILNLPRTIRSICLVQFFSWLGWFPVLFYSSTWVGDIYKLSQLDAGKTPTHDEATRAGSRALLYSSVLSFIVSVVAPLFVGKISLAKMWSASQAMFACAMLATFVTSATMIITATGVCWAITQWAPFSLLGEAILASAPDDTVVHQADEIPLTERPASPRSSTSSTSNPRSALFPNENARQSQLEINVQPEDGVGGAAGTESKAGIILGIHNLVLVAPQFIMTGLSAVLFALLEPHPSANQKAAVTPGTNATLLLMTREEEEEASPDSIGFIFRIGGLSAGVAAFLAWRLAKKLD